MTDIKEQKDLPAPPSPDELAYAYDAAGFAAARKLWNEYLVAVDCKPLPTERSKREWGLLGKDVGTYRGFYTALGV